MQTLNSVPREAFTADQVAAMLVAPDLTVDFGAELLDLDLSLVEDITVDLSGGTVRRSNYANVHGSVSLSLSRKLAWGRDRIRPYQVLGSPSAGVEACRFNRGVYVLTTPQRLIDDSGVITYAVSGFDLLSLLQQPVGDTYVVTGGYTYLQAVADALTASQVIGPLLLDGTLITTTLPDDMVWVLTDGTPESWLGIINQLLNAINYRGLWVDADGNFRSEPYQEPGSRAPEWTFDVTDKKTNIVGQNRLETADVWSAPNWWRFVRKGMTTTPVEGDGIYTYTNQATGASSVASVGRLVRAGTVFLEAADQASLVAQGNRTIAADQGQTRLIELSTGPFPIAAHFDMATLIDPKLGAPMKVQARSWEQDLAGADVTWIWEVVG